MSDLEQVAGLGENRSVSSDDLEELKELVSEIRTDIQEEVLTARRENEAVRFCQWAGQAPDGRKRRDFLGKEPKPFEGASDARVREADKIGQERVRLEVAAATRTMPEAQAVEDADSAAAGRMSLYLKWLVRNKWGSSFRRQVELLSQYRNMDTPAVAVAFVDWQRETCLAYREVTRAEVVQSLVGQLPAPGEADVVEINDLVTNPQRVPQLADMLPVLLGIDLKPGRMVKLAREIVETGTGQYPAAYVKVNEPRMEALRVYEDVFYPANTMDLQRARCIIRRHWYTRAEVLERQATEGWSEAFVRELIGDDDRDEGAEGKSAFDDEQALNAINQQLTDIADERDGLYEVLVCYRRAANEDGVLGIFVDTFSAFCSVAAKPRELWDRKHGQYPFVAFPRECLTSRLNDSRGIAELVSTQQQSLKLLTDSFEDHVQTTINPPIKRPRGRPFFQITLAPFGEIEEDRPNSIGFMERPPYPQAAADFWRQKRREINEYWGRFDPETNPNETLAFLTQQDAVDSFLVCMTDVFQMVVQLVQQYESDERLARISGGMDQPLARSIEEIQGEFDISMTFDVRDMDLEKVVKKAKVVLENLRPLDAQGLVPYDYFLRNVVAALNPNWAARIPPAEAAGARIAAEEQGYFVQILSGVEPPMPEKVDAPGMRLQTLQGLMEPRMRQPQAFAPLTPASVAIYNNRVKYLGFQQQQMANADTGRVGTEPVDFNEIAEAGA